MILGDKRNWLTVEDDHGFALRELRFTASPRFAWSQRERDDRLYDEAAGPPQYSHRRGYYIEDSQIEAAILKIAAAQQVAHNIVINAEAAPRPGRPAHSDNADHQPAPRRSSAANTTTCTTCRGPLYRIPTRRTHVFTHCVPSLSPYAEPEWSTRIAPWCE